MPLIKISLAIPALLLVATQAFSHGGGLDANGGHTDKRTRLYHCHRASCSVPGSITTAKLSATAQSKSAIKEAQQENRSFSLVYNREDWPHWIDADHDCQDTRAEVLINASTAPVQYRNAKQCSVIGGQWYDPYTGKTWTKASNVDIDHIITLGWAHQHGGANWPKAKKREFANDVANLIPVEDNVNQAKGDKGPAEWMPPNQSYRCEYLKRFNAVVTVYKLQVTAAEKRVMDRMATASN